MSLDPDSLDRDETADVTCGEPGDTPDTTPAPDVEDAPLADESGAAIPDALDDDAVPNAELAEDAAADDRALLNAADQQPPGPATLALPSVGATPAKPKTLTRNQAITILRALGWRIRTTGEWQQALKHFQDAWSLGPHLTVDGVLGPLTSAAMRLSEARRRAGQPTASAHFSFHDFACKCGGSHASCPRIWVRGELIRKLEHLRARVPVYVKNGLHVVSGCRCPGHNKAVGGAKLSQHQYGAATDLEYAVLARLVARWRLFSGIGQSASTHLVRHVDIRHDSGHNPTHGTTARPTLWNYSA